MAIICARNSEQYVRTCLERLIANGIEVCLIDHDSTDTTRARAADFLGRGLREIRHMPFDGTFSLLKVLEITKAIAESSRAEWVVYQGIDEVLESPVENETLRAAIERADREGFTVLDFDEFVFCPRPGQRDEEYDYYRENLGYYFFQPYFPRLMRVWKPRAAFSNLDFGGHLLTGASAAQVQHHYVLRHYLALSQPQVERKYAGRKFGRAELERGWHKNRLNINEQTLARLNDVELKRLPHAESRAFDRSSPRTKHFWEC